MPGRMKRSLSSGSSIWAELAGGKVRAEAVAPCVLEKPALLPEIFAGLDERPARVKFGCAKVLFLVSERDPSVLLPFWDQLAARLASENKILMWSAMLTLGHLAKAAPLQKTEALLPRLFRRLHEPVMITAANAMRSAIGMALAHPSLASAVARGIMDVDTVQYPTEACRNIALGHALKALAQLLPLLDSKTAVTRFTRNQLAVTHGATRKRAEALLKMLGANESHGQIGPPSQARSGARRRMAPARHE